MPDREKVIRGLESLWRCVSPVCHTCGDCPYQDNHVECKRRVVTDTLALLKGQEPRVLSKSEAEQYVTRGITDGYSEALPLYVEYQKPQRYYLKWVTLETANSWMTDYGTSSVYGSELRFWTSRPSEQQMRDTKWEGEDNAEIH